MKLFPFSLLLLFFFSSVAFADEASVKAAMEKRFPYEQVISVHKTPYFGLYEIVMNDQLVYTDEKMTYLFSGNIIDLHTMQNLTEEREKQLFAINFDALPLDLAIKRVKGNGKRRMAIFSDPNCAYCKRQEKEMTNLTDATIYTFMVTMLAGSKEKAKAIWCSPDRQKAWEDHMLRHVEPKSVRKCDTSALTRIAKAAKELNVVVTPTLIFADGLQNPGWLRLELLNERLDSAKPRNK
jgi:thiol:disulfide interchange protein DsbC